MDLVGVTTCQNACDLFCKFIQMNPRNKMMEAIKRLVKKIAKNVHLIPPHRIVSMVVDKFSVGFQPSAQNREPWSRLAPTKSPPQELASNSTI